MAPVTNIPSYSALTNYEVNHNIYNSSAWIPEMLGPFEEGFKPTYLTMEECDELRELASFNESISRTFNLTCDFTSFPYPEHAPTLTKSSTIRAIVLTAMALLSLMGNIATILSIKKSRSRRLTRHSWSAVYTLILHLSIADLLVTFFCLFGEAAWSYTVEWLAGNLFCKFYKFSQMFSLHLSTFVLVLIGLDRFLAVRYPMKSLSTAVRCNRLLIGAWVLSLVLSLPQLVVFRVARGPFQEEFYQCVTHGFYTEHWQEQLYTSLSLVFMFLLPLFILICTYVCTIVTIARSEKVFRAEVIGGKHNAPDVNRKRLIHRAKMKSLRISVVIVMAFIVCWTPYYTMMIIFMFLNPDKHVSDELQSGIFFFGMSNSLINPLIYGAFHLWPSKKQRKQSSKSSYNREHSAAYRRSTMTHATIMRAGSAKLMINRTPGQLSRGNSTDEETMMLAQELKANNNDPRKIVHESATKSLATKVLERCTGVIANNTTKL